MPDNDALDIRTGLPDALRVLLQAYPRDTWPEHDNFAGLVAFWLERHLLFRRLLGAIITDTERAIDSAVERNAYAARLSRSGGMLLQGLHGHHQIEDHHYFPMLGAREPMLERGFTLLDADHHAMDGLLDGFARGANAVIEDKSEPGLFHGDLMRFHALLDRHLVDEEELIVPVILKHGPGGLG
ncbi:hemerythrin domain-containing protein [Marivita sp. S2033]|uniref:hemerythrin domain-containing protein n=1 Tax=Marivita sp. S2033 TaxID=3373187 RepID=UPI003982D24E